MVAPFPNPVLRLPFDPSLRYMALGDVHGCFPQVLDAMRGCGFHPSRDRILSVGDLIDRGPESHRAAKFLSHGWVHCVRGNHEDLLLEAYAEGEAHPAVIEFLASRNGFGWWLGTSTEVRNAVVEAARALPIAIQIGEGEDGIGIVHADVPDGLSWPAFLEALEAGNEDVCNRAMNSRDRLGRRDASGVDGIGRVFVGHTRVPEPLRLGNVFHIDTGAVYGLRDPALGRMTFMDVADPCLALEPVAAPRP